MTKGIIASASHAFAAAATPMKKDCTSLKKKPITKGPALVVKNLDDWLQPSADDYQALLIQRPQNRSELQWYIDDLEERQAWGREMSCDETVHLCGNPDVETFTADLHAKAEKLVAFAVKGGLPKDSAGKIEEDFKQIGSTLYKMCPSANHMYLKLDIMGLNGCSRWHRDQYMGRAVVSYNSCGTQIVKEDDVDHKAFVTVGKKDGIVPDASKIVSVNVGDILFMKGAKYPTSPNGLIHRSPPARFHKNGTAVNRLLLKVDVN